MTKENKIIKLKSFSEILEFAESIGWVDTFGDMSHGNWDASIADECENEAIDFIESKGYTINLEN